MSAPTQPELLCRFSDPFGKSERHPAYVSRQQSGCVFKSGHVLTSQMYMQKAPRKYQKVLPGSLLCFYSEKRSKQSADRDIKDREKYGEQHIGDFDTFLSQSQHIHRHTDEDGAAYGGHLFYYSVAEDR